MVWNVRMVENIGIVDEMVEGRGTRDDKRSNKIRTVRDLKVFRGVILSSLFLAERSSIVPRVSYSATVSLLSSVLTN